MIAMLRVQCSLLAYTLVCNINFHRANLDEALNAGKEVEIDMAFHYEHSTRTQEGGTRRMATSPEGSPASAAISSAN